MSSIVSPKDVLAVIDDISTVVLVERSREMRTISLAALAGVNAHLKGPPGTAKSLGARAFTERITGARLFSKTVHAQMPADAIIGGYDMPKFAATGAFERNTDHYAPKAHIVHIGEITRGNGPTLDALLPMLNTEERLAEGNGGMFKTDILFMVTDSNFMPDPDDPQLGAFVDRITLMMEVGYINADSSFKTMLTRHHERRTAERAGTTKPVTITLEQFVEAQDQVWKVKPTDDFLVAYAELRRQARLQGLGVSDRKWVELMRVARANAWLAGRDELAPNDLVAIEDGLSTDEDGRVIARTLLLPYQGRFVQDAAKHRAEAEEYISKLNALRADVEAVPVGTPTPGALMGEVQGYSRGLGAVNKRVEDLMSEAEREKANVPDLRELHAEIQATKTWLDENNMPARW